MAKASPSAESGAAEYAPDQIEIDLKDPFLAAFLAWLIPGAGHWYQGRRHKAILFFVWILGTFVFGLYLGEGRVVYASWRDGDRRLPYLCQVGVGLPAMPALIQAAQNSVQLRHLRELHGPARDLGRSRFARFRAEASAPLLGVGDGLHDDRRLAQHSGDLRCLGRSRSAAPATEPKEEGEDDEGGDHGPGKSKGDGH